MKIRNRKLVSGVIAAFMAVLMTGVVFAFVAQGPLTFTGTANVDASLALAIVASDSEALGGAEARLYLDGGFAATNGNGHRSAVMIAEFDGLEQSAVFSFVVENIGTITAEIAPIVLDIEEGASERIIWTQYGALDTLGAILEPGEYVEFSFEVAFDAAGFEGWYYIATSGVSFVLSYGLVGSYEPYVPGPAYVAVEDIVLTVSAGPASNPQTRIWRSAGTRGWERTTMNNADNTGNLNHWHRSSSVNGRPSEAPYNMLVSMVGLGTNPNRHVDFTLDIIFADDTTVRVFDDAHRWQGGTGGTPHSVWQTFTSEDGRFVLNMRGNANNFIEWWLEDTSGVN